jgi:hypothetical protein
VKIQRGEMQEKGPVWVCTVAIPPEQLSYFLRWLPKAGEWVDVAIVEGGPLFRAMLPPTPAGPVTLEWGKTAPPEASPTPTTPSESSQEPRSDLPAAEDSPAAQIVAPAGFDVAKLGLGGRTVPKAVMVTLMLCRDPLFQAWVQERSGEPHSAIPDAVEFSARWVAERVQVPDIFATKDNIPGLLALHQEYGEWLQTRGIARAPIGG